MLCDQRVVSRADWLVLATALLTVASCGSAEPQKGETFIFGWILLGFLVLFMGLLFFGLVRYVRSSSKSGPERPVTHQDFIYEEPGEEEEEDK